MRHITLLLFLAAVAFGQDISYNFDKATDFTKFKTFKWVEIKRQEPLDELTTKQITAAIDAELATKGLTKTDADTADLYLGFQTGFKNETEITSYNSGWGYGAGWGRYGYGGGGINTAQTSTILIAAIALDMYDSAKKELVWRGVATKTVDTNAKPDKREKNIKKGVTKLLKNYPPKPKN